MMLAVNHLGPFLLTNLLLPLLEASAPSRVVTVASDAHRWGRIHFDDLEATGGYGFMSFPHYGNTKLMNILFTAALARRLEGTGVTANCVHPGAVSTEHRGTTEGRRPPSPGSSSRRPEQGARTSLYVATSAEGGTRNGSYFAKAKLADEKLAKRAKDPALAGAALGRVGRPRRPDLSRPRARPGLYGRAAATGASAAMASATVVGGLEREHVAHAGQHDELGPRDARRQHRERGPRA